MVEQITRAIATLRMTSLKQPTIKDYFGKGKDNA
jgi:hypothetical protein